MLLAESYANVGLDDVTRGFFDQLNPHAARQVLGDQYTDWGLPQGKLTASAAWYATAWDMPHFTGIIHVPRCVRWASLSRATSSR
jgi:hypothetical protein